MNKSPNGPARMQALMAPMLRAKRKHDAHIRRVLALGREVTRRLGPERK